MTFSMKTAVVAAVGALTLSACATATPYQPAGLNGQRGGYAEQRVEADRYRVSFSGNSLTTREQVEMGLLLRAAELTTQDGYDRFATVNRATDRDVNYRIDRDPFGYGSRYGYSGYWSPYWRISRRGYWSAWDDPFGRDYDVREVDRYEATAEIVMGRGPKPADDPNAFDAREVIQNVGGRITRPM